MVRRNWAKRGREERGRGKEESKPRVSPFLRIIVED
jgi:hypothetical protein